MSTRRRRSRIARALAPLRARRAVGGSDAGSVLLEAIVAMIVVSVVMVAVTGVLITGSQTTTQQRNAQRAVHLATTAMDTAQALGSATAISALDAPSAARKDPAAIATRPKVAALIATMKRDASKTAALTQTVDDITYTTAYFLGDCWVAADGASGDCTDASGTGKLKYTRVVTAVVWDGRSCPDGGCDYVTSGLLDTQSGTAISERQPFALTAPPATSIDLGDMAAAKEVGYVTATDVLAPPLTYSGTVAKCGGTSESLVQGGDTRSGFKLDPNTGVITHIMPTASTAFDQVGTFCFSITAVDAALNTATVSFSNWSASLKCHVDPDNTVTYGDKYYIGPADLSQPQVIRGSYYFKGKISPLCHSTLTYRLSGAGLMVSGSSMEYVWDSGILKCESPPGTWTAVPINLCNNATGDVVLYNARGTATYCAAVEMLGPGGVVVSSYKVLWKFLANAGDTPAGTPAACRT